MKEIRHLDKSHSLPSKGYIRYRAGRLIDQPQVTGRRHRHPPGGLNQYYYSISPLQFCLSLINGLGLQKPIRFNLSFPLGTCVDIHLQALSFHLASRIHNPGHIKQSILVMTPSVTQSYAELFILGFWPGPPFPDFRIERRVKNE